MTHRNEVYEKNIGSEGILKNTQFPYVFSQIIFLWVVQFSKICINQY